MPKPGNLKKILEHRRSLYGNMHAEWEREDKLVRQEYDGLFEAQYDITIHESSTSSDILTQFHDQVRTDEPTVLFRATGTSKKAQEHANLMVQWAYGVLKREREMGDDPNSQCAMSGLHPGVLAKRVLVATDRIVDKTTARRGTQAYRDWEARVAAAWPFDIRAVDPQALYPTPGVRKPLYDMLEVQQRTVGDMWRDFPEWTDPEGRKQGGDALQNPGRKVEVLIYWSMDILDDKGDVKEHGWYIVEADGERIIEKPNPYGFVSYIWEWSGKGRARADGDPKHLGVGLLRGKRGELEEEVRLKTAFSASAQIHVFPTLLTSEDPVEMARKFSVGPARVLKVTPGLPEPKFMEHPEPNQNILAFLAEVKASISTLYNPALAGGRQPGVQYGVLQAQMLAQALKYIAPIRAALDRVGGETLNMMARLMAKFDIDMNVEGNQAKGEANRMVSGEDFTHYNFEAKFEAVDPAEDDRRILVGLAMLRAGAISLRTFWLKYARHVITDPDEEEANLNVMAIMEYMNKSGLLAQVVLQEEGQQDVLAKEMAMQAEAKKVVQKRAQETVPEVTGALARELETISGTPGALGVPTEIAQEGMREARGR